MKPLTNSTIAYKFSVKHETDLFRTNIENPKHLPQFSSFFATHDIATVVRCHHYQPPWPSNLYLCHFLYLTSTQ